MSPPPLDEFRRDLQKLDYTRRRMEKLHDRQRISLTDLHSVYEALFIRAATSYELFLQDLFLSVLIGTVTYGGRRSIQARMTAASKSALMDIILQGRPYVTWLPYDNTEERARIYLKDGRPFSDVTPTDKITMKTISTIRNAIAHRSTHAIEKFENNVIAGLTLLPVEKKPAGFLRSRVRPTESRFEIYVGELGRIALALCP